jgi:transcription initiation factor TFIID subunit 10
MASKRKTRRSSIKEETALDPGPTLDTNLDPESDTEPTLDTELANKGKSISELLLLMDDYSPVIPDTVTDYYLGRAGFDCDDVRIKRLLGVAAQKFISDVATGTLEYSKLRQQSSTKDKGKNAYRDKKNVLTMDDLALALSEHGINAKKPDYFL